MRVRERTVALAPVGPGEDTWLARIDSDAHQIARCLPEHLKEVHEAVVKRTAAGGGEALILSGSTARRSRTAISDLDYHLIGDPIETTDLSRELDLHVLSFAELEAALLAGDDFVQWSLRFGLVVFDHGPVRDALALVARRNLWPDSARKRDHAAKSLDLARRFVATGDKDGAIVQVRTALSLAARAHLLGIGVFPLSRAELPTQLQAVGQFEGAAALTAFIHATPAHDELERAVMLGDALLAPPSRASSASGADERS